MNDAINADLRTSLLKSLRHCRKRELIEMVGRGLELRDQYDALQARLERCRAGQPPAEPKGLREAVIRFRDSYMGLESGEEVSDHEYQMFLKRWNESGLKDALATPPASVSAHAMFVADVCGALEEERTGDEV